MCYHLPPKWGGWNGPFLWWLLCLHSRRTWSLGSTVENQFKVGDGVPILALEECVKCRSLLFTQQQHSDVETLVCARYCPRMAQDLAFRMFLCDRHSYYCVDQRSLCSLVASAPICSSGSGSPPGLSLAPWNTSCFVYAYPCQPQWKD
jgi:hypothetical protein